MQWQAVENVIELDRHFVGENLSRARLCPGAEETIITIEPTHGEAHRGPNGRSLTCCSSRLNWMFVPFSPLIACIFRPLLMAPLSPNDGTPLVRSSLNLVGMPTLSQALFFPLRTSLTLFLPFTLLPARRPSPSATFASL